MLKVVKPLFNLSIVQIRLDLPDKLYFLALFADNMGDFFLSLRRILQLPIGHMVERDFEDTIETFFQMLLNTAWLLRITQYLDKVLVREEKEARELVSLFLQIIVQIFLYVLELEVGLLEDVLQVIDLI